jgi:hypothetical protein
LSFALAASLAGCASGGGGGSQWSQWWILPNGGQINLYDTSTTYTGQFTLDGTISYSVTSITVPANYSYVVVTPSSPTFPFTINPGEQIVVKVKAGAGATDGKLRVNLAGVTGPNLTLNTVYSPF